MKFPVLIQLIALFLCSCNFSSDNSKEKIKTDTPITIQFFDTLSNSWKPSNDEKFLSTFHDFKEALLKEDYKTLSILSTNCIHYEGKDFVEVDSFYSTYFSTIFDSNLLSRITQTNKINGHYDRGNWHIYSKPCIFISSELKNPLIAEVSVKIVDVSENSEGADVMLAFIDTKTGYKFCGYSTMP